MDRPPPAVATFLAALRDDLVAVAGAGLDAVYLHGSPVLGDFRPGTSDIDVLAVTAPDLAPGVIERLAGALTADRRGPGIGLEASIVERPAAANPAPPWPYSVHVTTAPNDRKTVWCEPGSGDPDLVLHYVVTRTHGVAVHGPPPTAVIGALARVEVLAQLEAELRWAVEHAGASYAVLNACRALRYLEDGSVVSKTAGGEWALAHGLAPDVVGPALEARRAGTPGEHDARAATFVLRAADTVARG